MFLLGYQPPKHGAARMSSTISHQSVCVGWTRWLKRLTLSQDTMELLRKYTLILISLFLFNGVSKVKKGFWNDEDFGWRVGGCQTGTRFVFTENFSSFHEGKSDPNLMNSITKQLNVTMVIEKKCGNWLNVVGRKVNIH